MKKVLLDTNAYIKLLQGNREVLDTLARAGTIFMSVFVLGELYAGFKGGAKEQENRTQLDSFLQIPTVHIMTATQETADIFGIIKSQLRKAGTPIPINDVWIAAHTAESGSHLITFDLHFNNIPNILMWQ